MLKSTGFIAKSPFYCLFPPTDGAFHRKPTAPPRRHIKLQAEDLCDVTPRAPVTCVFAPLDSGGTGKATAMTLPLRKGKQRCSSPACLEDPARSLVVVGRGVP